MGVNDESGGEIQEGKAGKSVNARNSSLLDGFSMEKKVSDREGGRGGRKRGQSGTKTGKCGWNLRFWWM